MNEDNLKIWNKIARPPKEALKEIKGGRLSGMTDIKPQWRFKAMTEQFGMCGFGWKYKIVKEWTEQGSENQLLCFVNAELFILMGDAWSEAIPGTGGSMLITKERNGLHTSDEGFKMALTDALGVAMKAIGVAAEIYMGNWTGSKYKDADSTKSEEKKEQRNWIAEIRTCADVQELKYIYDQALKVLDGKEKAELIREKDKKKEKLKEPGPNSQSMRND